MASDIIIPQYTTANERLLRSHRLKALCVERDALIDILVPEGWIVDKDKNLYQPLFGLTAKTLDGKERTVVEGDIVLAPDKAIGVVVNQRWSFVVSFNSLQMVNIQAASIFAEGSKYLILTHVKDIVDGTIPCWECGGTGWYMRVAEHATHPNQCPACDGTKRRNVTLAPEGE